jgi:phage shock protein A
LRWNPAADRRNARALQSDAALRGETSETSEPPAAGISIRLQERIRDLEQTLGEERRALSEAEQRHEKLEEKYHALLQRTDPIA